jgi:hypothetical protein
MIDGHSAQMASLLAAIESKCSLTKPWWENAVPRL